MTARNVRCCVRNNALLHGADGYGFDEVLLFLALNIIQQVINGLGYIRLGSAGAQLIAETSDELRQVIQLFGIRKVVDTVREYFWLFAFGHASYLSATVRLASSMNSSTNLLASLDSLKYTLMGLPFSSISNFTS